MVNNLHGFGSRGGELYSCRELEDTTTLTYNPIKGPPNCNLSRVLRRGGQEAEELLTIQQYKILNLIRICSKADNIHNHDHTMTTYNKDQDQNHIINTDNHDNMNNTTRLQHHILQELTILIETCYKGSILQRERPQTPTIQH